MTRAPWCTVSDVRHWGTECESVADADIEDAIEISTDVLYELSGRRYATVTETVRPCMRSCLGDPVWQASWGGTLTDVRRPDGGRLSDYRGCLTHGYIPCSCDYFCEVELGVIPIASIASVMIDGLPFTAYKIVNSTYLARTDGDCWPTCQDILAASTEVDTFEVIVNYGTPPTRAGAVAAAVLACELGKSITPGCKCTLPDRVTTITRQQMTMTVLDPQDFLDNGRTGLYLVDLFLKAVNPAGQRGGCSVASPDWSLNTPARIKP